MKIGELQTTQDINQKFLMGELNGDEVWALEEKEDKSEKEYVDAQDIRGEND